MTTHPPERIIIDVETEGEFLTDEQSAGAPGATAPDPTTDGPGAAASLGARIAAGTLNLGRRELAAVRSGVSVLKAEHGAWLSATLETPAHLRADLLNRRYNSWTARQRGEAERLEEKATELDKQADRLVCAAQGEDTAPDDYEGAGKQAKALRKEAAAWREQARQIQLQPYTGHTEPAEADLERHRRRTAKRRRISAAALGLAIGFAELRIGGMFPALTAAGIAATAWAKGRITSWRRELPDVPPLAYELTTGQPAAEARDTTPAPEPETPTTNSAPPPRTSSEPKPPAVVTWTPSDDPYVMHIGTDAHGTDHYLKTLTDNPHAAYVGGSGSGKTTALTLPLVHNRQHDALVDLIDLKRMSYTERDDEHPHGIAGDPTRPSGVVSGVRIHTTLRGAVAALAEFLASATAVALMQQAGQDTNHIPSRVLLIDEYGSFAGAVKAWWKGPGAQKGPNVIPFWMHVCLMQGRALEHRLAVGAHQLALDLFGGSDARDLFSGRLIIGDCSAEKWVTTYGRIKKPYWDGSVKGRGVYGPLGATPTVVQVPYIPQSEANTMLRDLPDGPAWFDAGTSAPWITETHIREVEASYSAGRWVPGWEHLFTKKKRGASEDGEEDDIDALADELFDENDQHDGTTDDPTPRPAGPDWLPDAIRSIHAAGPAGMKPSAVADLVSRDRKTVRQGLQDAITGGLLAYRDNGPHSVYVHPDHT